MTDNPRIQVPRNSLQLLKWAIFEPVLLKRYSDSLDRKQAVKEFLNSYLWIALFSLILWVSANLIISIFDLPSLYPDQFKKDIIEGWQIQSTWFSKFIFFSQRMALSFAGNLALGLAVGLIGGLAVELSLGVVGGVAGGLAGGLAVGLAGGVAEWVVGGLVLGLVFGLAFGVAGGLIGRLAGALATGLIAGLAIGLAVGATGNFIMGLEVMIGMYLSYFRILPFYPVYFLKSLFSNTFADNSYRSDGVIWLPIPGLKSRLVKAAQQEPDNAFKFIDFLMEYRPLQKNLAMHLVHAATAGRWSRHKFSSDIIDKPPIISEDRPKFQPSETWLRKLADVRQELVAVELQSGIGYKIEYFERYLKSLKEFRELNKMMESSRWNHYYTDAITQWLDMAEQELQKLHGIAKTQEPVTRNIYRPGPPLTPENDKAVFFGRDELRQELQYKIMSSPNMPIFLIQGQRRVGKTSLLKFLPEILGPRFKVVFQDVQPVAGVYDWLKGLQKAFDETMGLTSTPLPEGLEHNWIRAWELLLGHLEDSAADEESKIILALDEYEKLQFYFRQRPDAAAQLLDAMRSFSQHQDKIVFLFVGTAFFAELTAPTWSNHFTQAIRLKMDYLSKQETLDLIGATDLKYPEDVIEKIYELTVGHPTLVQRICYEMVHIANRGNLRWVTMEDLEKVLKEHIYVMENGVTEVFWLQFCLMPEMRTTVRQIIAGQPPTDLRAAFTLAQHGFTVKDVRGLRMRVPIFEEWIKEFGNVV